MEAEKVHNLPSAIWRRRKASGVIQFESKGLTTRGADYINSSSRAEDEMRSPSSSSKTGEKRGSLPSSTICSIQTINGLDDAQLQWGRAIYFTESIKANANLIQKHPHRHAQKQCFIQVTDE